MYQPELSENPFTLDPSLKSLLTFKEQEKQAIAKEEYFEKPHDRLYYTYKGSTQYGLIKKLEDQAFGLTDLKDQVFANEKQYASNRSGNNKKTELPAINSNKKMNINQVVKEKKETLSEFLNKGKHIFLGKMMMDMKKEETLRLTEFIINEEETINEHEADFREHVKFSNTFIQDLNKDAEKTINESKEKTKEINKEHTKIAQLEQQIRTLESQIKKREEDKETYETYKKFFYELYEPALKASPFLSKNITSRKEDQSKFFLTQTQKGVGEEAENVGDNIQTSINEMEKESPELKFNNPKQMVELLKRIDDATIFLIHNTQEKEEDLEKTKKAFDQQQQQIDEKYKNRKEALAQVQKLHEKLEKERVHAIEKLNRLRLLEKIPEKNQTENDLLDKQKISQKIYNMCLELVGEKATREAVPQVSTSDDILKLMTMLERELEQLIKFYGETKSSEQNLKVLNEIEKKITSDKRLEKAKMKQELDKQKNLIAREKQRQKQVVLRKGRRPMNKIILEKEKETEKVEDDDANKNDDERYFKDNFLFMDTIKNKPAGNEERLNSHPS